MDPSRNPPADSLAAARVHVRALTECGLSRETLLRALLESYDDGNAAELSTTRLSVSTTSSMSSSERASVISTATSMSSVSSRGGTRAVNQDTAPPLPVPPAPPVKGNNRGSSKPQGAYWCTFCDVAFQRKFDWKRHEDEFHERYKRYPCPNCNRIFWGANTFNQHHKNAHGCTTCPHADRVVRYTHRKTAWYDHPLLAFVL
ncbi:uncharacterized protein THITE_2112667 [Thermothielavioides terrestris NRRL 8126]|uniref:C2H2-type domain-containing protein n=1 Tax=Thermothielavioides terrestris (strain ATCC 38088 / NRRL 8126) TaxID=578455 RepID=G2QZZ5_THETT|nr:uncharacterized protein THITE_2112667 [Thermothielavioides terrestris NRRL 8126]AEO65566.1 hypothetical protein THITE_2112667 [Thermothielavioides terrestris NRRL 8126]